MLNLVLTTGLDRKRAQSLRRFGATALAGMVLLTTVSEAAFIVSSMPIVPGGSSVTVPLTSAAAGTLLATLKSPFSFVTTAGTTSGTLLSAVYQNPSGTLDFYYQITNNASSATSLSRESSNSFTGFATNVAFRTDGSTLSGAGFLNGSIPPLTAERDTSVVGFNFVPVPAGTKISPGTSTFVLIISTNAIGFTAGNAEVIDGGAQTVASFRPLPQA